VTDRYWAIGQSGGGGGGGVSKERREPAAVSKTPANFTCRRAGAARRGAARLSRPLRRRIAQRTGD